MDCRGAQRGQVRGGLEGWAGGGDLSRRERGDFEYLSTKWELVPVPGGSVQTRVQLEIQFEFRNQFHAAMMSAVEGQMAGVMIEAFEKRIREVEGR